MKGRKSGITAGATSRIEENVFSMIAPLTCAAHVNQWAKAAATVTIW